MNPSDGKPRRLVVVLGMHRSGTSAIAGALAHSGVDFGDSLIPAKADNPRGFFEDAQVVELNDRLLKDQLQHWDSVRSLPGRLIFDDKHRGEARDALSSLVQRSRVCGVKDPRISLLLPFWGDIFNEMNLKVDWVVCLRRPESVARSLFVRDHFSYDKSHALWLKYNLALLDGLRCQGVLEHSALLSFEDLIENRSDVRGATSALLERLSLKESTFYEFFDSQLANRARPAIADDMLTRFSREVYVRLMDKGLTAAPIEAWSDRWRLIAEAVDYIDLQYESLSFLEEKEKKWIDGLKTALAEKDAELERVGAYANELLGLLDSAYEDAKKQRDYTRAVEVTANDERAAAQEREAKLRRQLQVLLNRCEKYFLSSSHLEEQLHELRTELENSLAHAREELTRVYASTSWRVSAPLRALKRSLTRN